MEELNWPVLVALILFPFVLVLFKPFIKIQKLCHKNLPPTLSPPSLPILGHLHLLKSPLHKTLHNFSKRYGPDLLFLRFGVRKVLVITSPSALAECFTKNDVVFSNRPLPILVKYVYNYQTLGAAPYSHLWRSLRRFVAAEVFSATRLNSTRNIRENEVRLFVKEIVESGATRSDFFSVELKSKFSHLLNNIITVTVMGKRFYGAEIVDAEEAEEFRKLMGEFMKFTHLPHLGDFLPFLRWVCSGVERRLAAVMVRMDKFLDGVIAERRYHLEDGAGGCGGGRETWPPTVVDKLVALQDEEPELYTDDVIKGIIMIMVIAGTETPYLAMEWAMSLLFNHPDVMEKVRKEIETNVGYDRLLDEQDIEKLNYLQNVISETLRLYPTMPLLLPREASEDCTICGHNVPKGTMLIVNAWSIQRDPKLWLDPEKFVPERFEEKCGDKYKMLPFGVGRRQCPGYTMGNRVLALALGTLLQVFEWERSIGGEKVDMAATYGMSMAKSKPLVALCKPRRSMTRHLS